MQNQQTSCVEVYGRSRLARRSQSSRGRSPSWGGESHLGQSFELHTPAILSNCISGCTTRPVHDAIVDQRTRVPPSSGLRRAGCKIRTYASKPSGTTERTRTPSPVHPSNRSSIHRAADLSRISSTRPCVSWTGSRLTAPVCVSSTGPLFDLEVGFAADESHVGPPAHRQGRGGGRRPETDGQRSQLRPIVELGARPVRAARDVLDRRRGVLVGVNQLEILWGCVGRGARVAKRHIHPNNAVGHGDIRNPHRVILQVEAWLGRASERFISRAPWCDILGQGDECHHGKDRNKSPVGSE